MLVLLFVFALKNFFITILQIKSLSKKFTKLSKKYTNRKTLTFLIKYTINSKFSKSKIVKLSMSTISKFETSSTNSLFIQTKFKQIKID